MIEGVIRRRTACILIGRYVNAFMPGQHDSPLPRAVHDKTDMHPGVVPGLTRFSANPPFPPRLSSWEGTATQRAQLA
jgi:hypothetical protein